MPFQDHAEYPRGIFHTSTLTNVGQEVGPGDASAIKVSHIVIESGGVGDDVIIFRNSFATAEYFRVRLAAQSTFVDARGFYAPDGLEVLTAIAAGDVYLTIFYVEA
jgi:hypothetical protein